MARILWNLDFEPGSYFPAVPIVQELLGRGHSVTAISEGRAEADVRALGCDFLPATRVSALLPRWEVPPRDRAEKSARWKAYGHEMFADVSQALAAGSYDALLADPLELGSGLAAEAAGIPWCSYVHFAMDETGADTPFTFHIWDGAEPADAAFRDWWNSLRDELGLPPEDRPAADHAWWRHSRHLTLVLGIPELVSPKGQLPPYARRVGPSVWAPAFEGELPDEVARIGSERPALLASVSTLRDADLALIQMVGEAAAGEGWDVVATVAGEARPAGLPPNVVCTPFLPHDALLRRVSLVACHAGYGTVTRAACAGVPLLLFPDGRDRFNAARGAVAAGMAIAIEPRSRSAASVAAALHELMHEGGYARRAAAVAAAAARYNAAVASAEAIEEMVGVHTAA